MTTPTNPPPDLSDALAGQYAFEREIGRGGMGVVYLARDLKLDRSVAIKTLPAHLATDGTVRQRFLREARTAASLSHPNIVPIHRADELAGQAFFVMGYVDGESMAARVRTRGRLTPREVVSHLRDVAGALAYAHARHVIHRDVKAENILLEVETERALVTDFGIARLAESAPLTATGQMLGTVYYLSPEQISGDVVDARTDIYSLGVVGYLALSGRFPFDAPLASAVLIAHVNKALPPLLSTALGLPPGLAAAVERCLAKDPRDRYASCRDLLDALREFASDTGRRDAPPPIGRGAMVSDTEAHAILQRAAELDEMTAARARPIITPGNRDTSSDLQRKSGFPIGTVREAALEVGIDEQYVDRAMAERGLLPKAEGPTNVARPGGPTSTTGRRITGWPSRGSSQFLIQEKTDPSDATIRGAKVVLRYFVELDGEGAERDFDLLVDLLRREAGNIGHLSTVGRSLMWESDPTGARDLRASVLSRDGKTTISVLESLESSAPRSMFENPTIAVIAAAALFGIYGLARDPEALVFGVPTVAIACCGLYMRQRANCAQFVGRSLERQTRVRALIERLAERAQASIVTTGA